MKVVNDFTIEQVAEGNRVSARVIEQDEMKQFMQEIKVDEIVGDVSVNSAIDSIIANITQRGESALRDNELFILKNFGVVSFGSKRKITYRFALVNAETGSFKSENNSRSFIAVGDVENALDIIDTYLVS